MFVGARAVLREPIRPQKHNWHPEARRPGRGIDSLVGADVAGDSPKTFDILLTRGGLVVDDRVSGGRRPAVVGP